MVARVGDSEEQRKARGAFFTPPAIADYLARHAIKSSSDRVLDPTCGESVFLIAGGQRLASLGASPSEIGRQMYGVDLHGASLKESQELLRRKGLDANLTQADFFTVPTPDS